MTINVVQLPETKVFTSLGKTYKATYPNGYPITVRRVWNCVECGQEVGGHFGNKVYGDFRTKRCNSCVEKHDPIVQMCLVVTGLTPAEYQKRHGVAWNE